MWRWWPAQPQPRLSARPLQLHIAKHLCCRAVAALSQALAQLLLELAGAVGGLPSPSLDFAHAHYNYAPTTVISAQHLCCRTVAALSQAMGQLLLQLACAVGGLPSPSLDFAHAHYSPEFVRLLMLLLGVADGGGFSWRAVSALLGERLLLDMDTLAIFNEQLVSGCSSLPSHHKGGLQLHTLSSLLCRGRH
jgi:hypothetical protein